MYKRVKLFGGQTIDEDKSALDPPICVSPYSGVAEIIPCHSGQSPEGSSESKDHHSKERVQH